MPPFLHSSRLRERLQFSCVISCVLSRWGKIRQDVYIRCWGYTRLNFSSSLFLGLRRSFGANYVASPDSGNWNRIFSTALTIDDIFSVVLHLVICLFWIVGTKQQPKQIYKRPESRIPCTLIPGDGVGPELVYSVQEVFKAANCPVDFEPFFFSEINPTMSASLEDVCASIRKNKLCLKVSWLCKKMY